MVLKYPSTARRAISGAGLSQVRRRMSAVERAVLAADILDGRVVLQGLTAKAVSELVGANLSYVHRAVLLTPEQRIAVVRGDRPLITPAPRAAAPAVDWAKIGDDMLVEAIKMIGVNRTLDAAAAAEVDGDHFEPV